MSQRMLVLVGSYAETDGSGIYVYSFDSESGAMERLDEKGDLKNPTFLNVDASGKKLYAINEGAAADGGKTGEVIAYRIDPVAGTLQELDKAVALNNSTCHIQRDGNDKVLIMTSYHGGTIGLMSLQEDGKLGEVLDVVQHVGSGPHPNQDKPHPHSAFFSPDEQYVFVSDLGIDRIRAYKLDREQGKLVYHGETAVEPGAGPRHLVFHPNGQYAYVINELNSTVTAFSYDAAAGSLQTIESVSTLPADYDGANGCAEITISADGRFVYGSNRGHDSIVVYAVDQATGKLQVIQHISTEGGHPRHFALTPDGKHLIVANRDANNLTLFLVDQDSGKLTFTGQSVKVSKPVCVQPIYFTV